MTAAGHYASGETIREGVREVEEELGIKVDFDDLISLGIRVDAARVGLLLDYEFSDVFFLINDDPIEKYTLQAEEVSEIVSFKVDDGLSLVSGMLGEITGQVYRSKLMNL